MCGVIYFPQVDGAHRRISRLSEVKSVMGVSPVIDEGYPSLPDDCCLCPCDIEATAEAAGYIVGSYDELGDCTLILKRGAIAESPATSIQS